VLLHLALWLGIDHIWVRPLLLTHLGVFLLWQPLWRSETKLSWVTRPSSWGSVWLPWYGLTGGCWRSGERTVRSGGRARVRFYARWQRVYHLLLMAYLLALLLLYIAPHLFGLQSFEEVTGVLMAFGLPLLLVVMALLPVERDRADGVQAVDFIYVLLLFTLLTLLVLAASPS